MKKITILQEHRNQIKTITIACVGLMIALGAQYGNTAEVKIDFQLESGGGPAASTMTTSASGINGDIVWTSTSASWSDPEAYRMQYLIDNSLSSHQQYAFYWLTYSNRPTLTIVFPEEVYITKIRTFNFITNSGAVGPRWSESALYSSTDGSSYSFEGNVTLDADPAYTDYVDVFINDYIKSVQFVATNSGSYYAMNEIEMYTDNAPPSSIPEPASISLMLMASLAGLVRKSLNR